VLGSQEDGFFFVMLKHPELTYFFWRHLQVFFLMKAFHLGETEHGSALSLRTRSRSVL